MRAFAQTVEVAWGAASHAGQRRDENQDAFVANPPLFMVADGMGGHEAGREAAALVAVSFTEAVGTDWVTTVELAIATEEASRAMDDLARRTAGRPGSTVTGVALAQHQGRPSWLMFNIGDSRTYLVNDGVLEQVTVDHSRVQELLDHGASDHEARQRVSSNLITRAIGGGSSRTPDLDQWLVPIQAGDRVLTCSDGLTGELSDALIAATLLALADPGEAAQALVDAAVAAGGRDNVTAVVVDAVSVEVPAGLGGPVTGVDTVTEILPAAEPDRTAPDHPDPVGWRG